MRRTSLIVLLAVILMADFLSTVHGGGAKKGKRQNRVQQQHTTNQIPLSHSNANSSTIGHTLTRVLNNQSAIMGAKSAPAPVLGGKAKPPANTMRCERSDTIPVPEDGDLYSHLDHLLDAKRFNGAKAKALNAFDDYRDRVWDFLGLKKVEMLVKPAHVTAPDYIYNVAIYHTFRLADTNMGKFHIALANAFVKEYTILMKKPPNKDVRGQILDRLKQRIREYELRVIELDCMFQKIIWAMTRKDAQPGGAKKGNLMKKQPNSNRNNVQRKTNTG